ncbi:glycoside hydrolase family 28 protein [Granulicella sp. L46]|uniref:glycoside hydrolase family 28 protein n=1 Tax=Granulicella sp. L46 TaxID=1641865 RepID=UPI0020B13F52|nr:glycoside hydrolase family 28 protein [Granulicella sp. L46]
MQTNRRGFLRAAAKTLAALPLWPATRGISAQRASGDPASPAAPSVSLDIKEFGAVGDGKTNDTLAIQQALDRCSVLGGGQVCVPSGEYLTGAIMLHSNTTLHLDADASLLGSPNLADYPLTQVRWEGHWVKGYIGLISAVDANNIGLTGRGRIVGNPAIKGRVDAQNGLRHPALLEFVNCSRLRVEDCVTEQNDMWSIHPVYCDDALFRNVTVRGGADGIDVDSCRHVVIESCTFSTGDDCISLKSGRGAEGYAINRPTEEVRISNCTFADSHWACVGIGSETSGGIRNIHIDHCKCIAARTFAIYIKSRPGRGAFIENIYVSDLDVSGAEQGFLRFNILNSGKQDEAAVPGEQGIPTIRNFNFNNIRVKDVPVLVDGVGIDPDKPLEGLSLTDITGTCGKGIFLANIKHAVLRNIGVTGYTGALLNTYNVTGVGLAKAAPLEPTKIPAPIPAPAQPYLLH